LEPIFCRRPQVRASCETAFSRGIPSSALSARHRQDRFMTSCIA
jgi:hypothetical protein